MLNLYRVFCAFNSHFRYQTSSDKMNGSDSEVYWSQVFSCQKYTSEFLLEISDYQDLTWHIRDNYIEDFIWNDNRFHCERGLYFNNGWLRRIFTGDMIIIGHTSPTVDNIDPEYAYNIYYFLTEDNVFVIENDINLTGRELHIIETDGAISYIIKTRIF